MPWDSQTKIMTGPVNSVEPDGDLQQASGLESGDVGYCVYNGGWNKWAKYKPVRLDKIGRLMEAELKAINYGLTIGVCGPSGNITSFISGFSSQWSYDKPVAPDRFRALDLLNPGGDSLTGYRGDANSFIDENNCNLPSSYQLNREDSGVTFILGLNYPPTNLKEGSVNLSDLRAGEHDLSAMYFGLVFVYNNTHKIVTDSHTISEYPRSGASYPQITIPESGGSLVGIDDDTFYTVYPVLSASAHTGLTTFSSTDIIVALPKSEWSFKAKSAQASQNMEIRSADSYLVTRGRVMVRFSARLASSVSGESIVDGRYEIRSASASGATGGALWKSGDINGNGSMVSGTWYTVSAGPLIVSNQRWAYVKVYRGNEPTLYDEAWTRIRESEEPDPPIE